MRTNSIAEKRKLYYDLLIAFLDEHGITKKFTHELYKYRRMPLLTYVDEYFCKRGYHISDMVTVGFDFSTSTDGSDYWYAYNSLWKDIYYNAKTEDLISKKRAYKSIW